VTTFCFIDSQGNLQSRPYIGEPRFVAFLLNVTSFVGTDQEAILVPRSLFFQSLLYAYLSSGNPPSLVSQLSYMQNATSGSWNADDLQELLVGNVSLNDFLTIVDDLDVNATGATIGRAFVFSINDEVAGNPLFYSLPDGVVRLVGYLPPSLTSYSATYTFCTSSCGQPTDKPWWEEVWEGIVTVVTAVVTSAIVIAVTAFQYIGKLLQQVGNWFAQQIANFKAAVASAVQAAAKVLGQLLNSFFDLFTAPVKAVLAYLDGWKADIVRAARNLDQIARAFDGSPAYVVLMGAAIGELLAAVFRPDIILLLTVMSFAIIAAVTATIATGIGYLIVSQVVPMIISLIVSVVVQAVAPAASSVLSWLANLVDTREWVFLGVAIAGFDVAVSFLAQFGGPIRPLHVERVMDPNVPDAFRTSYGETINNVKTSRTLILAILGFVLALIPVLVALPATAALILDLFALSAGMVSLADALGDPARHLYGRLTLALSGIEVGLSAFGVLGHIDGAARGE